MTSEPSVVREPSAVPDLDAKTVAYINLKLALLGCPTVPTSVDQDIRDVTTNLLAHHRETERLLANYLSPVDQRIQSFLYDYYQETHVPKLPTRTLVMDRAGLARALSLPVDRNDYANAIVTSYRVRQGVLHNPKSDRRTTQGIFHIADGGLPIPADKIAVPKATFARLFTMAFSPPPDLLLLPFTATQAQPASCFVSLMLRPTVCPEVPGYSSGLSMETRFFAPAALVSNLDFVESIFGNAGDPFLPENDAALDVEHWTGHTGCVVLAPHLVGVSKKAAGLPAWDQATERQRRDGMCWKSETELYNNGQAFKLTCRDESGVIVTIIADNYFGYCKKEVKTQISYAANLFGLCEEEHAGGAIAYASYDLGEEFSGIRHVRSLGHSYEEMIQLYGAAMHVHPDGYAVDKRYPNIIYVRERVEFELNKLRVSWTTPEGEQWIKLHPGVTYVRPSGYKVEMEKPPGNRAWRLVGTVAEGTLFHKPCTVSGGGKSEISKSLSDAIIQGPTFVADFRRDFDEVAALVTRDYSGRFNDASKQDGRPILSPERSLGSVIKLLTPSPRDYTPLYNAWLESVPQYIKELVFVLKRFYRPEWGDAWREHFSVDVVNGKPGNELKCENRKLVSNYLRVGYDRDGAWRTFGLRKDFHPGVKLQREDDITASVVVPPGKLPWTKPGMEGVSVKYVRNCENRLFQRPDDAIHPGYDRQAEADFSQPGNFFSNYQPLSPVEAREIVEDSLNFYKYSDSLQGLISDCARSGKGNYLVVPSHPRLVDGKPSKNPRYLQLRPDLVDPRAEYLGEMAARLQRRIPLDQPVYTPVDVVLPGRRNNPPDGGIRPLCVFSPIHYMELPELFMEFICSMTGKSPSTTGAGSEGALTKGPFNALPGIIDLNNALVSWILTGQSAFVTSAGWVGPHCRVDHDISLLVPEVWSRMAARERDPVFLREQGYLEKCQDFVHNGKPVLASRLGYRVNARFSVAFLGRVFNHPHEVLTEAMLCPELQDMDVFADGVDNIVTTQRNVALLYFEDGSVAAACPPLKALLHIMAEGAWEGKGLEHPEVRALFTLEYLLKSDWYAARLKARQVSDVALWQRHMRYLEKFLGRQTHAGEAVRLGIQERLSIARKTLAWVESEGYLEELRGTLGSQPLQAFLEGPTEAASR